MVVVPRLQRAVHIEQPHGTVCACLYVSANLTCDIPVVPPCRWRSDCPSPMAGSVQPVVALTVLQGTNHAFVNFRDQLKCSLW